MTSVSKISTRIKVKALEIFNRLKRDEENEYDHGVGADVIQLVLNTMTKCRELIEICANQNK